MSSTAEKIRMKKKVEKNIKSADIGFFKKLARKISEIMFPANVTCDVCGAELTADTRYNLCSECVSKMPFVKGRFCEVCGTPMSNEAEYCIRCQNVPFKFGRNRAPLAYEGEGKKLILSLKFGGKKYLADILSAFMADAYLENAYSADVLVWVPMTAAEKKKRGFNQSELLARKISERIGVPCLEGLIKVRETNVQKELTAKERAKNLEGAFLAVPDCVKGKKVVLIDDVFTTGATSNECAAALNKARAESVDVLTAAVTVQRIFA